MAANYGTASITDRMMRAARLESQVYDEVEHDLSATSQALTVVVISAIAAGIGLGLGPVLAGKPGAAIGGFILGIVASLLGWVVWSFISYVIGTKVFGGVATYGELLRTIGFAQSAGVLRIFVFVPIVGGLLSFAVGIWTFVATIVAMRQALDVDTTKAVLTALIGFLAYLAVAIPLGIIFAIVGLVTG